MTVRRAISYLSGLEEARIKPGLDRVTDALTALGHPHALYPHILVGGTNGKGSVVSFVGSVLAAAGLRAGLYTSPHLHSFEERIVVDGRPISEREADELVETVLGTGVDLSYFEFATCMALEAFRRGSVDVAVLEVGLGGRWDATNATDPVISVIASVGMDHASWLGGTIAEVAAEKAMIARAGRELVVGPVVEPALGVILEHSRKIGCEPVLAGRDFTMGPDDGSLTYSGTCWKDLTGIRLGLDGSFQVGNSACAVAVLERLAAKGLLPVGPAAVRQGLAQTRWAGRFQEVPGPPPMVVDAAHNPPGMEALTEELGRRRLRPVWLFAAMADKDWQEMIRIMRKIPGPVVATTLDKPRALPLGRLTKHLEQSGCQFVSAPGAGEALELARELARPDRTIVCAGSIFLAADILDRLGLADGGKVPA